MLLLFQSFASDDNGKKVKGLSWWLTQVLNSMGVKTSVIVIILNKLEVNTFNTEMPLTQLRVNT